ncbi:methylated-DNA--[protein]-cysteine S-methyltransferase [Actinomycetospora aeridis]|uniref:methylated-DNA--[protein]-cysteine S-methyltransferase n=1 Tax=Actinomycetospora aeridis TaxID=3129231 RepID=UPI004038689B
MTVTHTVLESPLGPLTLRAHDGVLSGLFMTGHRHGPAAETLGARDDSRLPVAREQLGAYFAGELTGFDLETTAPGTAFQQRVWAALREIPYGVTVTYGELAAAIGQPSAVRAVGLANGRNPLSIVVPCHRVVGATGALTGYGGGVERKRALLDLETRTAQRGSVEPARAAALRAATPSGSNQGWPESRVVPPSGAGSAASAASAAGSSSTSSPGGSPPRPSR